MEKKRHEICVFLAALIILYVSFISAQSLEKKQVVTRVELQQHMNVEVQYQQGSEGVNLLVKAKCESVLKPVSQITGALFGVDWC